MSEELKACPFCGKVESIIIGSYYHEISCNSCEEKIESTVEREMQLNIWNTRPIEDELRRKLDIAVVTIKALVHEINIDENVSSTMIAVLDVAEDALKKLEE